MLSNFNSPNDEGEGVHSMIPTATLSIGLIAGEGLTSLVYMYKHWDCLHVVES